MALFVALHKFKLEDVLKHSEDVLKIFKAAAVGQILGAKLINTWTDMTERSFCLWEAESKEPVEKFLANFPWMTTEVVPVTQVFPPSPDLYDVVALLVGLLPK